MTTFVTPHAWHPRLQHPVYGTADTYRLAAAWLHDCATVDDWGGGTGHFGTYLARGVAYRVIDGTQQILGQVLADLATYRGSADGILLRHVLDMTEDWAAILQHALDAFRRRLVVITFTPDRLVTRVVKMKSGWPIWGFNPADLRRAMGNLLVRDDAITTTHPERIYYLEQGLA